MITLNGKNLCERQADLNFKVKKAAKNKLDLQAVKCVDNSDVDHIFKIDLASEYKNIDYMIEELKSGDSLYICRVLRCKWLYSSDYADKINPDFLHNNVFPKMSFKMKNKMLSVISVSVKDERRAEQFFQYCMNSNLKNHAEKFLIFTSESFKINIMNDHERFSEIYYREPPYFKNLIGNSFTLAKVYAESDYPLVSLSYLYSVNEANYLDLLEEYPYAPIAEYLGVKISRSIMKKHKNRVLQNARPYLFILNSEVIFKYSSCRDAQTYLRAFLPENEYLFWDIDYYNKYKHIFDLLKTVSKFRFLKQVFEEKYGTPEFELNCKFCELRYYNIMTSEEFAAWGRKVLQIQERITNSSAVLSEGKNYIWCEFMPFAKSLSLIHYQLCKTTNTQRRLDMLRILVKSVKTKKDLETLLNYYYNKHIMSEQPQEKETFLNTVIKYHNVFDFNNTCWIAFDKILQNFQLRNSNIPRDDLVMVSFIYRVIKGKKNANHLENFIFLRENYDSKFSMYLNRLKIEERNLVFEYINSKIVERILSFEDQKHTCEIRREVRYCLNLFLDCRQKFQIKNEFPEVVIKLIKLDMKFFKQVLRDYYEENETKLTEGYLLRCLKEDASQIVELLPSIIDIYSPFEKFFYFRINVLWRKIKIYFANDITKQCIDYFTKLLYVHRAPLKPEAINGIVFAIFQLGDERSKIELLHKFAPTNSLVELDEMNHNDYITQVAICRFQGCSRPPVPLIKTALYIKGAYLPKCEKLLYMHLSKLSPNLRADFIALLLNSASPLVQKRGINLVLQVISINDELSYVVVRIWTETHNTTLRKTIYMTSLKRMFTKNLDIKMDIYRLLLRLTMSVRVDDDDEIFRQFTGEKIPLYCKGQFLEICWKNLAAYPETNEVHERKILVAKSVWENKDNVCQEFLYNLIYQEVKRKYQQKLPFTLEVSTELENIAFEYITDVGDLRKICNSLEIAELFTEECFRRWEDKNPTGIYYYQEIYHIFMVYVLSKPKYLCGGIIHIGEKMLEKFENKIGITKEYSRFWDWKLALITSKVTLGCLKNNHFVYHGFGFHLGKFVVELKKKNCYFISFLEVVFNKILSSINNLNKRKLESMTSVDASITIIDGLLKFAIFENYVLALKLLPTDLNVSSNYEKYLLSVLRSIHEQNNEEFFAFIKEKFNSSEAKHRKLMQMLHSEK